MTTMTTITAKRYKLYFFSVFICLVFFGYSALFLWGINTKLNSGHTIERLDFAALIFFILCCLFAIYLVLVCFKNAPIIAIDKHTIRFGTQEIYNVADIKNIVLTGKKPFKCFLGLAEGASIEFNDGTKKYIYDGMYSNLWQIKSFLEQVIINKKDFLELNKTRIDSAELGYAQVDYYKVNQLLTFRGLFLWIPIGFFVVLSLFKKIPLSTFTLIFLGIMVAGWIAFNSWLMNYFGVSRDYFVIKNHNFIWKKKLYRIDNIKEVVFEYQVSVKSNSLRIITKDYRTKLFLASTLRNETWFELKKVLEERGITVRNECIR